MRELMQCNTCAHVKDQENMNQDLKVPCDDCDTHYSRWESAKEAALLLAAKSLLAFLEDKGVCGDEDCRDGLVAFDNEALARLQEALQEAIKERTA